LLVLGGSVVAAGTAAELKRDANDVLLAHQLRSESLHKVLVASRRAS